MRSRSDSKGDLNGFLDAGSHINGELHFEDTFRIDGRLTGQAISEGDLVVGDSGEVDAQIRVGRIFVSGVVRGKVVATRRVEVTAGGKLLADIQTPSLVVEDGAIFEGRCSMGEKKKSVKAGAPEQTPKVARLPLPGD